MQMYTKKGGSYGSVGIKTKEKRIKANLLNRCTPSGIRTLDPLIKSQLLYQLS